jgi:hypothetical protein
MRSLVNPAVAPRMPRPKVEAAPPVTTFLLVEVPRHLDGKWGEQDSQTIKASAFATALTSFPGHFPGFLLFGTWVPI